MGPAAAPVCLQETSMGPREDDSSWLYDLYVSQHTAAAHSSSCQPDRLQRLVAGVAQRSVMVGCWPFAHSRRLCFHAVVFGCGPRRLCSGLV